MVGAQHLLAMRDEPRFLRGDAPALDEKPRLDAGLAADKPG
jgi:hypothetical protein